MTRKPSAMATEVRDKMRGGQGQVTVKHYFKPLEIAAVIVLHA